MTIGAMLLFIEFRILFHVSVPYDQGKMKDWPCFALRVLDKVASKTGVSTLSWWYPFRRSHDFTLWLMFHLTTSVVRLTSFVSANIIIGTVLGDLRFCEGDVERMWSASLNQSFVFKHLGAAPLNIMFALLFVVQITHLLFAVAITYPRYKQWTDQGTMPPAKVTSSRTTYYQAFEQDVIEYIDFRRTSFRRPSGTRFAYVPLCFSEVTSSQVLMIVAEACNMTTLESIQTQDMTVPYDKMLNNMDAINIDDQGEVREAIINTRKMAQDALIAYQALASHVVLYGFLFSTFNFHVQITYFNARCNSIQENGWTVEKDCSIPTFLWTGVVSNALNIVMIIYKTYETMKYKWAVNSKMREYHHWYERNRDHWGDFKDVHNLDQLHAQVITLKGKMKKYKVLIWPAGFLLTLNFAFAVLKFFMARFICPNRVWNVPLSLDLSKGCVAPEA